MQTRISNKKATFDYEVLETLTAGIKLFGHEAKAVRNGKASLSGARIVVRGGEAFLLNATIEPYQASNTPTTYDPTRPRKLLLSKKELAHLASRESEKGLTLIPLSLYNKGRFLKCDIAVVRGKKKHDKRDTIKKRDLERELGRTLK